MSHRPREERQRRGEGRRQKDLDRGEGRRRQALGVDHQPKGHQEEDHLQEGLEVGRRRHSRAEDHPDHHQVASLGKLASAILALRRERFGHQMA